MIIVEYLTRIQNNILQASSRYIDSKNLSGKHLALIGRNSAHETKFRTDAQNFVVFVEGLLNLTCMRIFIQIGRLELFLNILPSTPQGWGTKILLYS